VRELKPLLPLIETIRILAEDARFALVDLLNFLLDTFYGQRSHFLNNPWGAIGMLIVGLGEYAKIGG
jgi:hypothetical protein